MNFEIGDEVELIENWYLANLDLVDEETRSHIVVRTDSTQNWGNLQEVWLETVSMKKRWDRSARGMWIYSGWLRYAGLVIE